MIICVIYDEIGDLPVDIHCPKENTILLATEPVSQKIYTKSYLAQFGTVVSCQEKFAIEHKNVILATHVCFLIRTILKDYDYRK